MKKALQLSEQALRLALAVMALALAAWIATPKSGTVLRSSVTTTRPGSVLEW
ncbi:MAG TPA: hypothetical protein VK914_00125 [bacterium]|jgi:hypothetical protein|nr:hypothetical protein [bacterium]